MDVGVSENVCHMSCCFIVFGCLRMLVCVMYAVVHVSGILHNENKKLKTNKRKGR